MYARQNRIPTVSTRSPLKWGVAAGAVVLIACAVFFAPARWLADGVAYLSKEKVQLSHATGTIWSGSGKVLLTGGTGSRDSYALPDSLTWKISPSLVGFTVSLNADCCTTKPVVARFRLGMNSQVVEIEDSNLSWPARLLTGFGAPFNTLQVGGKLTLTTQRLVISRIEGRTTFTGAGIVKAEAVSSRLTPANLLGDYQISVVGGQVPSLEVQTIKGELKLSGTGVWAGDRIHFGGVAEVEPELLGVFMNLLNVIGQRQGAKSIITLS